MEWLNQLGEWLKQAWVYIPAVLSFISAIGVPSLVQIAKIFSSAKLYLEQVKTLKGKINVLVDTVNAFNGACNQLINVEIQNLSEELNFLELQKALTYNKKMQELIEERIKQIKAKIEELSNTTVADLVKQIEDQELAKKPTKKVKVKVVKSNEEK